MRSLAPVIGGLMMAATLSPASAADLTVTIKGLRSDKGLVSICLFSGPSKFPDCSAAPRARQRTIPAAELRKPVVFSGLERGVFAIAALHDENANGRLDTNLIGIPREGIAVSNNRMPKFSAPSFEDAAFQLAGPGTQSLTIVYR